MTTLRPLLVTALLFAGCQPEPDHPPPAVGCLPGENCGTPPPVTGGGSAGSGAGGSAGSAGSASALLQGNVVELIDDDFRDAVAFSGSATIEAEGASGGVVSARISGDQRFELTGVRSADPIWVSAHAPNSAALLRTLHPVAPGTDLLTLGLVRVDTIDFVLQLLSVPAERVPGAGQIVLRVIPRSGALEGVAGVTVSLGDAASIAYASRGSWSEVETETDPTGLAALVNVPASAFPGRTRTLSLGGTITGTVNVRIAADAVTLVEVLATDHAP